MSKHYSMVIDLHKCVGCGGCDLACKSENNVPVGFHWSNHILETTGSFPNTRFRYVPTLCNHCDDAPCVAHCPTNAMYKDENGLTLHDTGKCIGCRACQLACPYDCIYFNDVVPHRAPGDDERELVAGGTSSPKETIDKSGQPLPYYNPDRARTYAGVRPKGVVEKCSFCDHRLQDGEDPWCVVACPADARIFGDLSDPESPPRKALAKHAPRVLRKEAGTKPNVFYIRDY